jgi:ketosteroid isomerase-like protein
LGASQPSELIRAFVEHFNAGDLDGLLDDCYDDDITLLIPGSPVVTGKDGVRVVLEGFLAMKATMTLLGSTQVVNGDIALSTDHWRLEPADGDPVEGKTADVLRRQSDGSWKYVIDSPFGPAAIEPV